MRPHARIRWSFSSKNAVDALAERARFMAALRAWGQPGEDYNAAEVVYGELVGNVVRHANGPIEIELESRDDALFLHVGDRGAGFIFSRCRLSGAHEESGRGLFLVAAFAENVRVDTNACGGARVTAQLRIRPSEDASERRHSHAVS